MFFRFMRVSAGPASDSGLTICQGSDFTLCGSILIQNYQSGISLFFEISVILLISLRSLLSFSKRSTKSNDSCFKSFKDCQVLQFATIFKRNCCSLIMDSITEAHPCNFRNLPLRDDLLAIKGIQYLEYLLLICVLSRRLPIMLAHKSSHEKKEMVGKAYKL